jgi:copper chaperone NosL
MKKTYFISFAVVACFIFGGMVYAQTQDDIQLHKSCDHCGMDRGVYNYSRMLIEYDDGNVTATCSIHCAAVNLSNNIDKIPTSIKVADFNTKQLINAETAFWVIGGNKPGVMSKQGKWAFEKKADAEAFVKANQGKLASYEEAMNATYDDMYSDTNMIREKRKMKRMQMTDQKPGMSH